MQTRGWPSFAREHIDPDAPPQLADRDEHDPGRFARKLYRRCALLHELANLRCQQPRERLVTLHREMAVRVGPERAALVDIELV